MRKEERTILNVLNNKKLSVEKIDWQRFLEIANKNAVSGSLYKKIKSSNINVPIFVKKELKKFYLYNTKRNLVLLSELRRVLNKLKSYKKYVVLLKGFSTIALTKQDIGERYLSDIDLLCLKNEKEITKIIKQSDYNWKKDYPKNFYKKHFHHSRPLIKKVLDTNIIIETHQQLEQKHSPFTIPTTKLSVKKRNYSNIEYQCIALEETLVYLCIQTAYDNFFLLGLRNLLDIKDIIEKKEPDWEEMIRKSEKWNCISFVYKTLILNNELLSTKVPYKVLKKFKERSSEYQLFILGFAESNLFTVKSRLYFNLQKWVLRILLGKNIKQKVRLIIEALTFLFLKIKK